MKHSQYVSFATFGLLSVFAFSLVGCGSDGPELVPASGVVMYDGKPLASGSVMFQPERGRHSRADIQPDGTFVMTTFHEFDGATIGPQMVRVASMGKPQVDDSGEEFAGKSLIPRRYSNFRTSGITVDIPPEGDDTIVIELEKKKR